MATTPHHPPMYLLVHKTIQRLYSLNDVDGQYVPRTTGPGALKYAFIAFMDDQGPNMYEGHGNCNKNRKYQYGQITAGSYTGWDNRTVTVVGDKRNANEHVIRNSVKGKLDSYHAMNMAYFGETQQQTRVTWNLAFDVFTREINGPPNTDMQEAARPTISIEVCE